MRLIPSITGVLLGFIFVNLVWAQVLGDKGSTHPSRLNVETFSPVRWTGARWILFFHDQDSDSYYAYKATDYVANYGVKFGFGRREGGRYAVVSFLDGQVHCDRQNGARTQFLDFSSEDYRAADGVRLGSPFDPSYVHKRTKVVSGSVLDIVTKAVCAAVLAAHGNGRSQ